jgi:hypothetical protein
LKYHSSQVFLLTLFNQKTAPGGQFDWGGRLLKGNGGAQRFPQAGWKSAVERIGIRELDCEAYKPNRDESRAK